MQPRNGRISRCRSCRGRTAPRGTHLPAVDGQPRRCVRWNSGFELVPPSECNGAGLEPRFAGHDIRGRRTAHRDVGARTTSSMRSQATTGMPSLTGHSAAKTAGFRAGARCRRFPRNEELHGTAGCRCPSRRCRRGPALSGQPARPISALRPRRRCCATGRRGAGPRSRGHAVARVRQHDEAGAVERADGVARAVIEVVVHRTPVTGMSLSRHPFTCRL